jgi:GDP-D-mannose 3', 5'-epimerase
MKKAIITGAGGFIGSHLAKYLKKKGYFVIGIDLKHPEYSPTAADDFRICDLRDQEALNTAFEKADELYMLAADMGGIGYISQDEAHIMRNNILINVNSLEGARVHGIKKAFFASSACVYPRSKQKVLLTGLKEEDAIPAEPDSGYGWEKLFVEQLVVAYGVDFGIKTRIARFHNIFGWEGTFDGGREKSPAAICRKIAQASNGDAVEIWGDGEQKRSYCFVDDCCEGVFKLMNSNFSLPLNIGSDRVVTLNQLFDIVADIASKKLTKKYDTSKPQGVRERNSDNTLLKKVLKWEPRISLEDGLAKTYRWIESELKKIPKQKKRNIK